jgi:membrane protein YqaA with SNARE-associated domain
LTTYAIGIWGGPFLVQRILRISQESQKRAEHYFARYGSWALFFSWLPILGDPLCLAGGVLRIRFWRFILLVTTGKYIRYLIVAKLVADGINTL